MIRYFILCIFSCLVLFACTEKETASVAPTKVSKATNAKKQEKPKNIGGSNTIGSKDANYWHYIKKEVGLNQAQVQQIKKTNQSYAPKIKALRASKKWKGKDKRELLDQKTADLKKLMGESYDKLEKANLKWLEMNKAK